MHTSSLTTPQVEFFWFNLAPVVMPDTLSPKLKEHEKGALLRANITITQGRQAKPNDPRSAALSGATLAFAARAERLSAGAASGKPQDTKFKGDGARNAANIAHAEHCRVMDQQHTQQQQQEDSSPPSLKERVKHFSSELAPTEASLSPHRQPSPQHVAAQLAVDRSTVHAASKPLRIPAEATKDQISDRRSSIQTPLLDRQPTPRLASPSNYSQQSTIPAGMQSKESSSGPKDTNQRRLPQSSNDENPEEVDMRPRLPPRAAAASPRSASDLLTAAVPAKDSSLEPRAGFASRPPLPPSPLRQSQSTIGRAGREVSAYALSDARVASSLASSRASSPPKGSTPPPPPQHPLSRSKSLLRVAASNGGDRSRTPSPAKSLKQTMRTESKSDNEGERTKSNHHRILRTHPHKYQEGGRKRWQEKVTEAQRKRYEGVWAANKGLLLDESRADKVADVVVRDIWSRSRLPQPLLAQIWDLVSQDGEPMVLSREQFVVGMWLIDQSLQGRKLPWKVADSAWDSVRRFQSRPLQST